MIHRRSFLRGIIGAPLAAGVRSATAQSPRRPLVVTSKTNPLVREEITTIAWDILADGGTAMDATEKATNLSEADPRDTTVGYGGDPNEDGFLQLDASVMNGADNNNIGAVAALEGIKTPCSIARLVMERTDHWLLVGRGALRFAKMHGYKEEDLVTEQAREHWLEWKETLSNRDYYLAPKVESKPEGGGTINVLAIDERGDIAGVTSTVGHHFKIVGRVGDSPIIGAGLYVDNEVGAAGATGHGAEAVKNSVSFLVVEKMREGLSPQQACNFACQRVANRYGGRPLFNVKLVALNKAGEYGQCAIRGIESSDGSDGYTGLGYCVHDASGHRYEDGEALLPPMTQAELDSIPWR